MNLDAYWVRHGESTWNRAGVMQGQTAWPALTARGERDARLAAEELSRYGPTHVVSSDLDRAVRTARIIGVHLGVPVSLDPLLRERCWGLFEGRPVSEGHRLDATLASDQAVPHGESRDDVARRVRLFSASLTGMDGPVVVVTHGDVIREAVRLLADSRRHPDGLANGSIIRLNPDAATATHSRMSRQP
ncbi:histidine phosphatase family protein [Mycolicibacterium austroafricanum]|uniref:Histidine phosphatase family protein n=1 Tax=Mycolicibacterium austroafricanum TaxID=39687 RepID=A0ABT8H8T5_MYCAO|nr:histidine phosphatase family protein [Mycolicibacterium austroafricanum]MDN4517166.1 histidine phosphatase family protein [Mycolicibacterium austroafricanum]